MRVRDPIHQHPRALGMFLLRVPREGGSYERGITVAYARNALLLMLCTYMKCHGTGVTRN